LATYGYAGTIQKFTVAETGTYQIVAYGAQGGAGYHGPTATQSTTGGLGAEVSGSFGLSQGEVLEIVVGGQGQAGYFGGGGGGGSFVLVGNGGGAYTLLEAAGGGGGGGLNNSPTASHNGLSGNASSSGSTGGAGPGSYVGAGGQNGGGGGIAYYGGGAGGAGVKTDGASTSNGFRSSKPFHSYGGSDGAGGYKGGAGGSQDGVPFGNGGFGGGGGGGYGFNHGNSYTGLDSYGGGGGGGGYSGGGGAAAFHGGGGGGSFDSGAGATETSGVQTGSGKVIVSPNIVCFLQGSRILTARGDVAVERLRLGDLVVTASGAHRPIKWLGHRAVDCRRHERRSDVLPVRVSADAFGENRPARDLYLSPGHAVCVDLLGEALIPISTLVNGSSIAQIDVDAAVYWHVELDGHDILVAENLACESYLDCGNRGFFLEAGATSLHARPDAALGEVARAETPPCRPFHVTGPLVEAARAQLARRAEALGWALAPSVDAGLHLVVDGRRIEGERSGLVMRFDLPPECGDVWLVSEASRPCDVGFNQDERHLGVSLRRISVDGREIALADPRLSLGFHAPEEGWRWTGARARLPASLIGANGGRALTLELTSPALPHWRREARAA
jgi:hypothetical protein